VARVLIVGCGCRGRMLAEALRGDGHAVRGTTRTAAGVEAIEAAGAEAVVADPDRLGTLMRALAGVAAVCWLLGSAQDGEELHGHRLRTFVERLVDTPVRGLVYEGAGSVDPALLERGAAIVREGSQTWRIPVEVVDADPARSQEWVAAMRSAVAGLLAA
jgi:uncharacterized protein YbjT (DUF2867 family)